MKRRALLTLPLAVASSAAPRAWASDAGPARTSAEPAPFERFRFHAGALLLAPAGVGMDGNICVGTADGYIHSLRVDGSFHWSHSVHGGVTRRPIVAGALWFVATSAERIYALTAEGTLYWVFKPPSAIASELAADADGSVYFVGADRFLYGITGHGGVSLRAAFGELKSGPSAGPGGAVWAENQAGNLIRVRGQDFRHMNPEAGPELDFGAAGRLCDPEGREWRARADGVLELRASATSQASALVLTQAPLLNPSWSVFGHYVLISARDGLVVAVGAAGDR